MKLLVSGCTASVKKAIMDRPDRIGILMTPRDGNRINFSGEILPTWAADNDCFQGFNAARYLRFLAKIIESKCLPLWVSCPDVVADSVATRRQFEIWEPTIHSLGIPVALVGQDGLISNDVPWDRIEAIFIGGSTAWKMSDEAAELIRDAKDRNKLVHVGRVNSLRRIEYFAAIGIDTFDGSGFSRWGVRIPMAIRWIDRALLRG